MGQSSNTYHEPLELLYTETRDMHRALVSLQEELEAVDCYHQRADASRGELRQILLHNMREENDVLAAVNMLDQAGFHDPYALAMSPLLYNNLFRRYEGINMLQPEHLRCLCESGLYMLPRLLHDL